MKRIAIAFGTGALVAALIFFGVPQKKQTPQPYQPRETISLPVTEEFHDGDVRIKISTGCLEDEVLSRIDVHISIVYIDMFNDTGAQVPDRPEWERLTRLVDGHPRARQYSTINLTSVPPSTEMKPGGMRRTTVMFGYVEKGDWDYKLLVPYKDIMIEFTGLKRRANVGIEPLVALDLPDNAVRPIWFKPGDRPSERPGNPWFHSLPKQLPPPTTAVKAE